MQLEVRRRRPTVRTGPVGASTATAALMALGFVLTLAQGTQAQTVAQTALTVDWMTVRDARESAFSIEVPKSWKTYGGMFRFGYIDARPFVDMTSPDRSIDIRVGDASIPSYSTPNRYVAGADRTPFTAQYASGDKFAAKYGQARFGSLCASPVLAKSEAMAPRYGKSLPGAQEVTAGQAFFTCTKDGRAMLGYVYAETMLTGSPSAMSNKWYVVALGSFLAPATKAKAAGVLLKHSGESLAFNPAWSAAQQQRINEATRVLLGVAANTARQTQAMNARQAEWSKSMRSESDDFNDVLNGTTYTRDASGRTYEVPTGLGQSKWIDGSHSVVESAFQPGPGFTQLKSISH